MKLKRVQLVTMGGMGDYFSSSAYEVGKGGCEVKSLWMSEASGMVTIVIETPTGPHCRIIAPSMVLWAIPAEMPEVTRLNVAEFADALRPLYQSDKPLHEFAAEGKALTETRDVPPVAQEAGTMAETISENAALVLNDATPVKRGPGRPPKARTEVV